MKGMPAAMLSFRSAFAVAATAAAIGCARAEEAAEPARGRATERPLCFSTAQSREKIEAHKLSDPFTCMRAAAEKHNGEAIGARLCRFEEVFLYEISVLQRDGRIIKILVDATTGRPHAGRKDN